MSFLTKMFPKKVKTLGEFIGVIEKERITLISITPLMDNNFSAILVHEAINDKGRRIVYRNVITQRNGGIATPLVFTAVPGAMHRASIRLCLVGEQRVKALQKRLPKHKIRLIFEGKTVISFEDLHKKAKAEGIL